MDEIIYTSANEQVEKLKKQNLIISNEKYAIDQLIQYGYSNLIKSYRDPYMITLEGLKLYRSGVTFEQVRSLYILDKNLRNAVIAAMLDLEEHIKEAAADVIAESFGVHQSKYLQFRNYRDKSKKKYQFSLAGIISTMKKTLQTDKDPIAHYVEAHEIVPPWILFKSIYFSTIVNFIHQFKPAEQGKMIRHIYNIDTIDLPVEVLPELMMDTLFVCLEYRNISAHGGRIYNYTCTNKLRFDEKLDTHIHGFSLLLLLLDFLKYSSPARILRKALTAELNRHCTQFPEDITYLGQILNINITVTESVWVSDKSKKYHRDRHCSGLQTPIEMDLDEAKRYGYTPCKRCN